MTFTTQKNNQNGKHKATFTQVSQQSGENPNINCSQRAVIYSEAHICNGYIRKQQEAVDACREALDTPRQMKGAM